MSDDDDAKREAKRRAFAWARAIWRQPSRSLSSSVKLAAGVIANRGSLVTATAIVDWALPPEVERELATWMKIAAIAADMGQSDQKTVRGFLAALESDGWLVVHRRRTRAGYQAASVYLPALAGVPLMRLADDAFAAINAHDAEGAIAPPDDSPKVRAEGAIPPSATVTGDVTRDVTRDGSAPGMAHVDANETRIEREVEPNHTESLGPRRDAPPGQSGTQQRGESPRARGGDRPGPEGAIPPPLDRGIPNSLSEYSQTNVGTRAPASAHEPARTRGPSEPIPLPDIVPGMLEPRPEPIAGHARGCLDMLVRLRGQPRTGDDSRGAQRAAAACGRRALARPELLVATLLAMARRSGDESWGALGEHAERWLHEAREELERIEAERHRDAKPIASVRPIEAAAERAALVAQRVGGRRA